MMGLAIGSWISGRFLGSIKNPLLYYAIMEFGIGAFALCFPLVAKLADLLYMFFVSPESATGYSIFVRSALSTAVLLIPTSFMGATLPLLTDFFHRSPKHSRNWKAGLLYAANTLGAAIGIVIASFILIESIGVLATTFAAAGMNFIVAIFGYKFSRSSELIKKELIPAFEKKLDLPGRFALAVITASGALALASEVLWTRAFENIIGSSTYAFAIIVLLYLLGIAAGSWIMSLLVNRLRALPVWIAAMQLGMGLWTVISVKLFDLIGDLMIHYSLKMVSISMIFGHYFRTMGMLLPLALLSGACFPLATRIIDPASEDAKGTLVAKVYAWNTLGALTGSLAAGFIIAPLWDSFNSLYILAALYCLTAVISYASIWTLKLHAPYRIQIVVLLGLISVIFSVFSLIKAGDEGYFARHFIARNPSAKILFHKPGLQGVTSVVRDGFMSRRERLLINGVGMTSKMTDTKLMAHLPMLLHPDPENTLVICLGMGTTYRSAISYGKKVTVVELVKEVTEAFDYFYEDAFLLKTYPKGRIIVNDGRNFLKLTHEKFDVITVDPPPPIDAAGVNNLYSKEFIMLARDHLNKGGIMAHWMPYPGTASGVDDLQTHDMLVNTFAQVFPSVYVLKSLNKFGLHVIGSMEPINISEETIKSKLSNNAVSIDINEWEQVPFEFFTSEWMVLPPGYLTNPVITDNNPQLEFYLLRTIRSGSKKMHPSTH